MSTTPRRRIIIDPTVIPDNVPAGAIESFEFEFRGEVFTTSTSVSGMTTFDMMAAQDGSATEAEQARITRRWLREVVCDADSERFNFLLENGHPQGTRRNPSNPNHRTVGIPELSGLIQQLMAALQDDGNDVPLV